MAFFDDLGKKLSQVGQTAVQKTKELSDIARINSMISDEEKRVNNNYFQIGKLYVAMHTSDFEKDFEGMIAAIKASEKKIAEYHQQIKEIKGVVRCEKCGAEVDGNSSFCNSCGAPMPKQDLSAKDNNLIKCASCGAMIDKSMRFCTYCGKPMADAAKPSANIAQAADVQPEKVNCPSCGAQMDNETAFCTECGTKLK